MAGRDFTDSAFCPARARLPLAVFRVVLRGIVEALGPDTEAIGRWRGCRTFLVDGSSFSMSDTPALQAHFGQPSNPAKGCGFPVAHLLVLFDAGTGLVWEVFAAPLRSHDMSGIAGILPLLAAGDVLAADRGFCSFAHLAMLISRQVHAVFPASEPDRRLHARPAPHRAGPEGNAT
jgi:Transposase DDE domain